MIDLLKMKNRITSLDKEPRQSGFPDFGNPAIPEGPVAFRPTIARGLALSVSMLIPIWLCSYIPIPLSQDVCRVLFELTILLDPILSKAKNL
jgi:hypothetical protein